MRKIVQGAGTGSESGSTHTPTQADDTLSSTAYAQIMDLISEGPIFGPADDSFSTARSTYFDNTPIQNADGSNNFNISSLDIRLGYIDQTYIAGFDSTANTTSVGVELKQVTPWVQTFDDLTINAVRVTLGVQSLQQTNPSTGDVTGYLVAYQIQLSVDGGAFTVVVDTSFNGKASSAYNRSHRIELNGATSTYTIRVVRTTADTTDSFIQDTTSVVSYTELTDGKLRYPLSAVVAVSLDAAQFSSVPTRSYDMKGLLIKFPSNYNPDTRVYAGTWDGTFVTGWTDNPAWIFYDLVLNNRYGLGAKVDATMIDRFSLYQIAQYCDVMVSDGQGGLEPRFTCNCYIQSRTDAYKVLQDLASVFRGMAYWAAGAVVATSDMPTDPVYVYTAANVIQGQFKYVGSSLKTRYTVALVTWNDPANAYKSAVEYVEDADGVARYGINKAEITAFGCTSRTQAQRVGTWSILTSRLETNGVTFSVGLDGTLAQPGQIIAVADPARAGRRLGGRIHAVSGTNQVTVDKLMAQAAIGDTFTVVSPSGVTESSTISGISGNTVNVNPPLAAQPVVNSVYMIESTTVESQLFRVNSVAEKDGITFEINALQYEPGKYAAIDSGAAVDVRPITGLPLNTQAPPTSVAVSQYVVTDQGIAKTNMTVSWVAAPAAVAYVVQWRKDSGDWVDGGRTGGTSLDVHNIYSGKYIARVRAINSLDVSSVYATSSETTLAGKTGAPPTVATLTASTDQVFGIRVDWTFPPTAGDTAYTEIYYSHTSDFTTATQLGRYSYPTSTTNLIGLVAGFDMYFWARLVDTSGNIGAFFPAITGAGVHGMSSSDATAILAYLTGQITATQLSIELATPIAAIPSMQTAITANATAISTETTQRIDGDTALSDRIDIVSAQVVIPPEAGDSTAFAGATTVFAGIYTEQSARAEADLALASQVNNVSAQVNTYSNAYFAAVQVETTARISADAATASQLTTVQASVDSNTAAVATNAASFADINGRVSASYQIKTQVTTGGRTFIAGIGVGVDNNSGTVESQVLVTADRFAVLETTGSGTFAPFVIQGGQAFINSAFIGTAYITTAKIADAAITTAKIGAAQVGTAQIADAQITTAKIVDANITNAKIGTAAVQTANIADANITSAKIANANILNAHIGNAQVDTLKIGANAVTTSASYSFGSTPGSQNYVGRGGTAIVLAAGAPGQVGLVQFTVNGVTLSSTNSATAFATIAMPNGNVSVSNTQAGSVSILEAVR
jgi:predicted phage tail protein